MRRARAFTTLQLARYIATAVLRSQPPGRRRRHRDSTKDVPTQAVLRSLHVTGTCLCAERFDRDGIAITGTATRLREGRAPS